MRKIKIRVGFYSYPTFYLNSGGLQNQYYSSLRALENVEGIVASTFNPISDSIEEFDVIHVFGCVHGTEALCHYLKRNAVPIVLSSVVQTSYSAYSRFKLSLLDSLVRKFSLMENKTRYEEIKSVLLASDKIITLGQKEEKTLVDTFGIDTNKICCVPNGVENSFVEQSHNISENESPERFAFLPTSIYKQKNIHSAAAACRFNKVKLKLAGPIIDSDYYELLINKYADVIEYVGQVKPSSKELINYYYNAQVTIIPSFGEVFPLIALESLAAGTPVILTNNCSFPFLDFSGLVTPVSPSNQKEINLTLQKVLTESPTKNCCKQSVSKYKWSDIADQLSLIYASVLQDKAQKLSKY